VACRKFWLQPHRPPWQPLPQVRRDGDKLSRVNSDEQWLLDQGFVVEVEEEELGLFWAHLASTGSPSDRMAPNYGRGTTPDEAIGRARRRYEVEELDIEPSP
jgi:hypothetical protein